MGALVVSAAAALRRRLRPSISGPCGRSLAMKSPGFFTCLSCPTYIQAEPKMRSSSSSKIAGSV